MKIFIKTVCITLCISFSILFFSSYKIIEAAAVAGASVPFFSLSGSDQKLFLSFLEDVINGLMSSPDRPTTYVKDGVEYEYTQSNLYSDTIEIAEQYVTGLVNDENFLQRFESNIQAKNDIPYVIVDKTVAAVNTSLKGAVYGASGGIKLKSDDYLNSVSTAVSSLGSGAVAGIVTGITNVNGKPQKVTTTYSPEVIEAFEDLGITYTMTPSITDVHLHHGTSTMPANFSMWQYYGFFIIANGNLYMFGNPVTSSASLLNYTWESSWGAPMFSMSGIFAFNRNSSPSAPYLPSEYVQEMKFCEVDGRLCIAAYQYYINSSKNTAYEYQLIFGNPEPTLYPKLFEKPVYSVSPNCQTSFQNRQMDNICFYNILDSSDILSETDVLAKNYECCGYIEGSSTNYFISTNNLGTAAKIIGQQSTSVSGGENTFYSELSDIEKAIYALAQQQGITYEEMLNQCNILINENGEMYLEGLDGVSQSIESLLSEFDKLIEQGDITNENIAASTEQLKAILEYLKGLNIEGLGSYIQELEATLDGLRQGDEEREAILGDISGQLTDMKEYLDSLGLSDVASDIKNISQILSDAASKELDVTEIENIDPDWYIEKFPFCLPFDFYRIITLFVRDPVPPVFTVPIQAEFTAFGLDQSVDEEIVLDLTVFKINGVDIVQVVLNFVCILGFVLMLIHNTTKFFV